MTMMDSTTKALIRKYLTGAAVAAIGGAVGAATTMLEAGPVADTRALLAAMGLGALVALRLWMSRQMSGIPALFGLQQSFGDKLAASPDEELGEGGLLYKVLLPNLESAQMRSFVGESMPAPAPTMVEVRKFSDVRLQEAVEHVFANSGGKNGMFFNVNLDGEIRAGVAVKTGGHLSIGGFLLKKPGSKMEGLVEVTFAF